MVDRVRIKEGQVTAPPELIESGLYFREAVNWYSDNFLSPVGASLVYIALCIVSAVIVGTVVGFVPRMLPLKERVVMVIKKDRPAGTFLSVKPLRKYQEPSYNIMLSMVKNYVMQRETYTLKGPKESPEDVLRRKKNFVEATSSKSVAKAFNRWVSGYNSITGDFLLSDVQTNIVITSAELDLPKSNPIRKVASYFIPRKQPNSATVYFKSISDSGAERTFKTQLGFEFALPKERGKGQLYFKVVSHSTSKV